MSGGFRGTSFSTSDMSVPALTDLRSGTVRNKTGFRISLLQILQGCH